MHKSDREVMTKLLMKLLTTSLLYATNLVVDRSKDA